MILLIGIENSSKIVMRTNKVEYLQSSKEDTNLWRIFYFIDNVYRYDKFDDVYLELLMNIMGSRDE